MPRFLHKTRTIRLGQRHQQGLNPAAVYRAQHRRYSSAIQLASRIGDGLIEQRQPVTQTAIGCLGQLQHRIGFAVDAFRRKNLVDLAANLRFIQTLQIELQAAAEHRHQQFFRVSGGEQEFDVLGRLFQCLQQRIEGLLGQHVHFVDQIHLVLAAAGHVLRVFDQLAHIVHARVGRGINLQQVDIATGINRLAGLAFTTRIRRGAALAIERFGENARNRGFAHPARTGEQECVVNTAGFQRVGQRTHHMLLPDQFGKTLGTPLAGKHEIGHAGIVA